MEKIRTATGPPRRYPHLAEIFGGPLPQGAAPRGAEFGVMRQPGFGQSLSVDAPLVEVHRTDPHLSGSRPDTCSYCADGGLLGPAPDLSTKAGRDAYMEARQVERHGRTA